MPERLTRLAEVAKAAELAPLALLAVRRAALHEALRRRDAIEAALAAERGGDGGSPAAWAEAERWRSAQRRRLNETGEEVERLMIAADDARAAAARAFGRRRALESLTARARTDAAALRQRRRETDGEPG